MLHCFHPASVSSSMGPPRMKEAGGSIISPSYLLIIWELKKKPLSSPSILSPLSHLSVSHFSFFFLVFHHPQVRARSHHNTTCSAVSLAPDAPHHFLCTGGFFEKLDETEELSWMLTSHLKCYEGDNKSKTVDFFILQENTRHYRYLLDCIHNEQTSDLCGRQSKSKHTCRVWVTKDIK